ncbi:hypothetical protein OUZ56_010527 [Daphnia magna]|uniref:Uncharacterized protein n=1 Tax=Daphnia magna TaxID=35525 RepID=A0ABR0AIU0_9CRUS|nr:hypothetical protein OUZ56_010527 [Daphnia magna]
MHRSTYYVFSFGFRHSICQILYQTSPNQCEFEFKETLKSLGTLGTLGTLRSRLERNRSTTTKRKHDNTGFRLVFQLRPVALIPVCGETYNSPSLSDVGCWLVPVSSRLARAISASCSAE